MAARVVPVLGKDPSDHEGSSGDMLRICVEKNKTTRMLVSFLFMEKKIKSISSWVHVLYKGSQSKHMYQRQFLVNIMFLCLR